jgi:hypothetical protein
MKITMKTLLLLTLSIAVLRAHPLKRQNVKTNSKTCRANVNLVQDFYNCGECSNVCPTNSNCILGKCVCHLKTTRCDKHCVDLQTNPQNCGSCTNACKVDKGEVCELGKCGCVQGGELCGDVCRNLKKDNENCGKCGYACPQNQMCSNGACVCKADFTLCGDKCLNLLSDKGNCGQCGSACAGDLTCLNGTCGCSDKSLSACDDKCLNLLSDKNNCSKCGNACPGDLSCVNGTCGCSDKSFSVCTDKCFNLLNDNNNCGKCGTVCTGDLTCVNGTCGCSDKSLSPCSGKCLNLSSDLNNCGTCGNVCGDRSPFCRESECCNKVRINISPAFGHSGDSVFSDTAPGDIDCKKWKLSTVQFRSRGWMNNIQAVITDKNNRSQNLNAFGGNGGSLNSVNLSNLKVTKVIVYRNNNWFIQGIRFFGIENGSTKDYGVGNASGNNLSEINIAENEFIVGFQGSIGCESSNSCFIKSLGLITYFIE